MSETSDFAPAPEPAATDPLVWVGRRLSLLIDGANRLGRRAEAELEGLVAAEQSEQTLSTAFGHLLGLLGLEASALRAAPDEGRLPMIAIHPEFGYAIVVDGSPDGGWTVEFPNGRMRVGAWPANTGFLSVRRAAQTSPRSRTARTLFHSLLARDRMWLPLSALASTLASILVIGTSFYSMQVYDRVIGQGGQATLIVLTVGVIISIAIEFALKLARSAIVDRATTRIDVDAAIKVFDRLTRVRLDQFPPNVGTLAAQVRGFETVRAFDVAKSIYLWTDLPFAILFLVGIAIIGGPPIAMVPLAFFAIALAGGLVIRRRILRHADRSTLVGNKRQGLLVEAVQGVEVVKAFGARWTLQARWNELSRAGAAENLEIKRLNDLATHLTGVVQQLSYTGIVAVGAYFAVVEHTLTVGAIIACSILSGRALAPAGMIPGLLVQWANAQVALESLEKLYALEAENDAVQAPIVPETVRGRIDVKDLAFAWPGMTMSLEMKSLRIAPGEKIGVLGMVGAGKSTLLKLINGSVKAREGLVLLDGLDVQQICAERRAETIGYLPQVSRLVSGTLRDNLTIGLPFTSDDEILRAAQLTGLADHILARPKGLDLPIQEGGEGLSRGQKQLIGLTRVILGRPELWLLDEPTASMDDATEERCLQALRQSVGAEQTLILVTHKLRLLDLVDRLLVITPRGIALDGPRDAVLARLQQQQQQQAASASAANVVSAVRGVRDGGGR